MNYHSAHSKASSPNPIKRFIHTGIPSDPRYSVCGVVKTAVISSSSLFRHLETGENIRGLFDGHLTQWDYVDSERRKINDSLKGDVALRLNAFKFGDYLANAIFSVSEDRVNLADALSLGMITNADMSETLGMLPRQELSRLKHLLADGGFSVKIPGFIETKNVIAELDKVRVKSPLGMGRIFALPRAIGEMHSANGEYLYGVDNSIIEFVLNKNR